MKIKTYFLLILIIFSVESCYLVSQKPDILIKQDFTKGKIAVLNFSSKGSYFPKSMGIVAANKLTDALFLVDKYNVIDRSKINNVQLKLKLLNAELLSDQHIRKIGKILKADYIILGRVRNITDRDFLDSDAKKKLSISFRIISLKTLEIIGIINSSDTYENNPIIKIKTMMEKIVKEITEE